MHRDHNKSLPIPRPDTSGIPFEDSFAHRDHNKAVPTPQLDTSGIPFENSLPHQGHNSDGQSEHHVPRKRESTITATEKAVFDRIYKSLVPPAEEKTVEDDVELDDLEYLEDSGSGEDSLEGIFNTAISSQEKNEQDIGTCYPRTHQSNERIRETALNQPVDEYGKQVEQIRNLDRERVTELFDKAVSDVKVWQTLEKEVFSRVEKMNQEMKEEEKQKATDSKKNKKGQDEEAREEVRLKVRSLHHPPSSTTTDTKLKRVSSLEILEANYASHCLKAMRLLRIDYPASPFASALIPQMKRLGSVSYVLGASTSLYNELLYIRWVHFHDIHGVAALVDEMLDHGIGIDAMTITILRDGRRYRKKAAKGEFGPVAQAVLQLQGIAAGWTRWNLALQKAYSDKATNDQRREEEKDLDEHEAAEDLHLELDSFGSQESGPQRRLTYRPLNPPSGRLSRHSYPNSFAS